LRRRIAAQAAFFIGIFLMSIGLSFLLSEVLGASRKALIWPFVFMVPGAALAIFAVRLNKRSIYLFFAVFIILCSFFLFLSAFGIIPFTISRVWPLISVFSGLALLPTCVHRYGKIRIAYLVPALAFIVLGSILLVFSFHIFPFSFKQFMVNWWPVLLSLSGILLFFISISHR
jgi:hypothetical protein